MPEIQPIVPILNVRDPNTGKFVGITAMKGDKGEAPVKGQDYWTELDKNEIVQALQALIPTSDAEISAVSTNPVQNKAVSAALETKQPALGEWTLIEKVTINETAPFSRTSYNFKGLLCKGILAGDAAINQFLIIKDNIDREVSSIYLTKAQDKYFAVAAINSYGYWSAKQYGQSAVPDKYSYVSEDSPLTLVQNRVGESYIASLECGSLPAGTKLEIWGIK